MIRLIYIKWAIVAATAAVAATIAAQFIKLADSVHLWSAEASGETLLRTPPRNRLDLSTNDPRRAHPLRVRHISLPALYRSKQIGWNMTAQVLTISNNWLPHNSIIGNFRIKQCIQYVRFVKLILSQSPSLFNQLLLKRYHI